MSLRLVTSRVLNRPIRGRRPAHNFIIIILIGGDWFYLERTRELSPSRSPRLLTASLSPSIYLSLSDTRTHDTHARKKKKENRHTQARTLTNQPTHIHRQARAHARHVNVFECTAQHRFMRLHRFR